MSKDTTGHYADVFKNWDKRHLGPMPATKDLAVIHALGARPGKQALANAMALRPQGVTGSEIVVACGAPQLNKMRGFIADGLLKREAMPPRNGHTVYKLTLTAKGASRTKAKEATTAPKAKKPRVKKPVKPVTVPAEAVANATPEVASAM